jgi:hypothetical protein
MKFSKSPLTLSSLALSLCIGASSALAQDHGHLRIGATNTAQGTPLYFYNGPDFAQSSGYVKTLIYTNAGRFAGYYQGNVTLTVQAATPDFSGPEPDAPSLGTLVQATIVSVEGPAGGSFGFWESGANSPTISVTCGETNVVRFNVTQTDGSPGADPFGHIHGRRMTATLPGTYVVTFQAHDASTNGAGGGPIHASSDTVRVAFQAGVCISAIEPDADKGQVRLRFGSMAGFTWQIEYTHELGPAANWLPAEDPVTGTDYFIERIHQLAPGEKRFYRLKGTLIEAP